jgi:hypothetical protein
MKTLLSDQIVTSPIFFRATSRDTVFIVRLNRRSLFRQAYCHYQEAALHLRHVLELRPNYGPALAALQDMDSIPDSSVHVYTLVIIVILVLAVVIWIITTLETRCQCYDF